MATLQDLLPQLQNNRRSAAINTQEDKIAGYAQNGLFIGAIHTVGTLDRRRFYQYPPPLAWETLAKGEPGDTWELADYSTFNTIHKIYLSCGL